MNSYENLFSTALKEEPLRLSPAGQARRETMRGALSAKVVSRRRQRRAIRAVGALGFAAALIWLLIPMPVENDLLPEIAAPGYEHLAIQIVQDDPGLLSRTSVRAAPVSEQVLIDDAALIDLLQAADHPSGIMRVEGRLILTDPIVTEEPPD